MEETDYGKNKPLAEDSNSPLTNPADTISIDDGLYNALREDLEADARDFEAPTWSVAVDQQYLKNFSKEDIKRQDVIHELIQTEINHVRTIKLVLGIYVRELRETLQMDETQLERLFPQVDSLLQVHQLFLNHLKQRRIDSLEPGSTQNYCIHRIGDILMTQFSGEIRDRMQYCYGVFCSHHTDAVNFYKDLMQNNKKFQSFIRKVCQLSIVRRLGIPEIILLITQRITKYPVLFEHVIKYTKVDSEEHRNLVRGLELLKSTISQVNTYVDEFEKAARLRDLSSKLEPKSQVKTTHGRVFRREDMLQGDRKLLHEGVLNWRLTSNKSKDVLVLLLSDVLLLLLEKDQRLTFASLDGKPAVISLLKLIVRDVAHDEKALFLISASSDTPEMYEFHTSSGEERKTWKDQIWKAVERCPEEEKEEPGELPERIQDFQRNLCVRDALIELLLKEKQSLFSSIAAFVTGVTDISPSVRHLLHGSAAEPLQGEQLLNGAIKDVEILQNLLLTCEQGQTPSSGEGMDLVPLYSDACMLPGNGIDSLMERRRDSSQWDNSDPQHRELYSNEYLELSADEEEITIQSWSAYHSGFFFKTELYDTVTKLSQKIYSLQSLVQQLGSHIVVQRATIEELMSRPRSNTLLEKEKHRNLEKQREELANFQRLQNQHRQEQVQWEQEREQQRAQAELREKELRERELECSELENKLTEDKQELARWKSEYQEDLERLRDSTRSVEKDREKLEKERKKLEKDREKLEQLEKKFKKRENVLNTATFPMENQRIQLPPPYPLLNLGTPNERPPLVPPRRESITIIPVKPEVPIHLISTTNQFPKASSVQQKIPTKLADKTIGKEKHSKQRISHHRTKSAAGIEVSQVLPIKGLGKEGGSLRAMRSKSPLRLHPDMFVHPEQLSSSIPSHSGNSIRKHNHNHNTHTTQPGHRKTKDNAVEDIIYF
ncbi:rho guanine nucleotide exchange factor 18 [Carassius gibelio]|uniref:rho guanine nucleotide exchange factor 18 n=1 Tax=Carassius gibelio TaxID=101364 RepID=UPI002279ADC0|nr:rho guanine nucleotide exchange factor 18 [Carassius gibelio]XP_052475977.1 rho guanine nucleotide exchange factor 18 [Carassius gibelio]XP_052475984.1 rho guanine nucleotide exchange factor 18 [Carassius gibelio]XP_052475993.1 rho guanine nucleotide exchange factor 18 [Carassius gibelio]